MSRLVHSNRSRFHDVLGAVLPAAVVLMAALLVAAPSSAIAQPTPGSAGIFFDAAGTLMTSTLTAFVPFEFYAVAFDLPGDLKQFEISVSMPPEVVLLGSIYPGPCICLPGDSNIFIVLGQCVSGTGPVVLASFQGLILGNPDYDRLFCLDPTTPSNFAPPTPGYLTCDDEWKPFCAIQPDGWPFPSSCAVGNPWTDIPKSGEPRWDCIPEIVPTRERSWTALKAAYGD